jgi:hypothetical protein
LQNRLLIRISVTSLDMDEGLFTMFKHRDTPDIVMVCVVYARMGLTIF